jgi:hypothetical protein
MSKLKNFFIGAFLRDRISAGAITPHRGAGPIPIQAVSAPHQFNF